MAKKYVGLTNYDINSSQGIFIADDKLNTLKLKNKDTVTTYAAYGKQWRNWNLNKREEVRGFEKWQIALFLHNMYFCFKTRNKI